MSRVIDLLPAISLSVSRFRREYRHRERPNVDHQRAGSNPIFCFHIQLRAVQIAVKPNDINYNLEKIGFWLKTAVKEHNAELVVFPESITTGFTPGMPPEEFYNLLNYIPGPETDQIGALARELKVHVILPIYEKGKEKNVIMNSSILINDEGEIAGIYRKTHPFPTERIDAGGGCRAGAQFGSGDKGPKYP